MTSWTRTCALRITKLGLSIGMILIGGCASDPSPAVNKLAPQGTGFTEHQITLGSDTHKFAVFVPFNYNPQQKYPTIVFLHGIGEGGDDAHKNLGVGIGPAIAKDPANFPFIVIFPQSGGEWGGPEHDQLVMAALKEAQSKYSIDPDRIILTGLSTGGYGTWAIGSKHTDVFAALVPMCAYDDYDAVPALSKTPVWAFHNSVDPFVFSGGTKEMVSRLQKEGDDAKFTEYGAFGHDCWSRAYDDPALFQWMLEQRLK